MFFILSVISEDWFFSSSIFRLFSFLFICVSKESLCFAIISRFLSSVSDSLLSLFSLSLMPFSTDVRNMLISFRLFCMLVLSFSFFSVILFSVVRFFVIVVVSLFVCLCLLNSCVNCFSISLRFFVDSLKYLSDFSFDVFSKKFLVSFRSFSFCLNFFSAWFFMLFVSFLLFSSIFFICVFSVLSSCLILFSMFFCLFVLSLFRLSIFFVSSSFFLLISLLKSFFMWFSFWFIFVITRFANLSRFLCVTVFVFDLLFFAILFHLFFVCVW